LVLLRQPEIHGVVCLIQTIVFFVFVSSEASLQALLAEAGSGVDDVEAVVGCSTLPGESTPAAAAGDSISSTSGNSVAGGQSTVRGVLGAQAEVSVIAGDDVGERAVVSGWKRR
jgi:hypothetical protein